MIFLNDRMCSGKQRTLLQNLIPLTGSEKAGKIKKNLKELILSFSNFVSVRGSLTEHFYDASTDNGDKSTIPLLTGCKRDGLSSLCHHISFAPRSYEKWIGAQVQYCNWFPAVYQGP